MCPIKNIMSFLTKIMECKKAVQTIRKSRSSSSLGSATVARIAIGVVVLIIALTSIVAQAYV